MSNDLPTHPASKEDNRPWNNTQRIMLRKVLEEQGKQKLIDLIFRMSHKFTSDTIIYYLDYFD